MKIVQEENMQQVEHHLIKRYPLDLHSCLFFILGMMISGFIAHHFIL
jgi:hypothetical protein